MTVEPDHLLFVLETSVKAFIATCQSAVRRPLWFPAVQPLREAINHGRPFSRLYNVFVQRSKQRLPGSGLTVGERYISQLSFVH